MFPEMLLFPKSQFLLFNLVSTYLPVKSKFKTLSSFGGTEGNNIDISAGFFPPNSLPRVSQTFFTTFFLYNFEPVGLNGAVFYASSEMFVVSCDDDTKRPRVLRMEGTVLSSTDGRK
jgi:hypothetical protein